MFDQLIGEGRMWPIVDFRMGMGRISSAGVILAYVRVHGIGSCLGLRVNVYTFL